LFIRGVIEVSSFVIKVNQLNIYGGVGLGKTHLQKKKGRK